MEKRDFLAHVARLVRLEGRYISNGGDSEGTAVRAYWTADEAKEDTTPEPEDYQIADSCLAFSANIGSDASQYAQKAANACLSPGDVLFSKVNLIGSILDIAMRAVEDETFQRDFAESKSLNFPSGHELTLRKVRVVQMRTITLGRFERNIVKFATQDGNILTWWASKMPQVRVGQDVRLNGRIKGVSEYQGVHETLVTRCQLGIIPKVA